MILDYKAAAEMEKEFKEKKGAIQGKICTILGSNEVGLGDTYGCSWKEQSKMNVDSKRLKELYPKAYADCAKPSKFRVFRTKQLTKREK